MVQRYIKTAMARSRAKSDSSDLFTRIQRRAYELYEKRGYSNGSDWSDWFQAERHVKSELKIR